MFLTSKQFLINEQVLNKKNAHFSLTVYLEPNKQEKEDFLKINKQLSMLTFQTVELTVLMQQHCSSSKRLCQSDMLCTPAYNPFWALWILIAPFTTIFDYSLLSKIDGTSQDQFRVRVSMYSIQKDNLFLVWCHLTFVLASHNSLPLKIGRKRSKIGHMKSKQRPNVSILITSAFNATFFT